MNYQDILNSHPHICAVEYLPDYKERGYDPQTRKSFRLHAKYNGHDWHLLISIAEKFPFYLPSINIENVENYPAMGHVEWNGHICYKDSQGLAVSFREPETVLRACIYEALRTLHENYSDPEKKELQRDFKSYWESFPSDECKTTCIVNPNAIPKELIAYRDLKNKRKTKIPSCLAIVESNSEANESYHLLSSLKDNRKEKSIYIPLKKAVIPPPPKDSWNATDILNLIKTHSSQTTQETAFEIAGKQRWSKFFTLILSHPKPEEGHNIWGIAFHRKDTGKHPLITPQDDWKISPLHLKHHNKEYLLQRSGASTNLDNKKIAIIGCGSVGGGIAFQLAKAGVGELHLFDFDKLEPENIYRHVLGGLYIDNINGGYPKVLALKWNIEMNIPYTKVEAYTSSLLELSNVDMFSKYDTVIVATGDFTSELFFNSIYKKSGSQTPIIYTWQDGFGIGGHAISVVNPNSGCLECLYTRPRGFEPHMKTSFIKQGQTISKHIGGCAGVFTPYSFLDASETSLLATRMTLEALHGKSRNEIRSWLGSDAQLKNEGYNSSEWYENNSTKFIQDSKKYIASNCAVCGKND
mgnify:CR=1 FL=1